MRRRSCRRVFAALLGLVLATALCACAPSGYGRESVKTSLPLDGEVAEELCKMLRMLTVNSPIMPEFDSITEAMEKCRDSVLYYMLTENYGKYTGDIEKLDSAAAEYPQMQIANLIPAREFEETVYTSFGGTRKITNESGRLFVYLDKIAAYTSVSILEFEQIDMTLSELSETDNTYRMRFTCSAGEITSPEYTAVFVKRDDGTVYFSQVRKSASDA